MISRWIYRSEAEFQARHALTLYHGQAEDSHDHQWRVAIRVGVEHLNSEHYGIDFHAVHRALDEAVSPLDGTDLNDHPTISNPSPTAESVALFIADALKNPIERLGGTLLEISVWEGPDNQVDLRMDVG